MFAELKCVLTKKNYRIYHRFSNDDNDHFKLSKHTSVDRTMSMSSEKINLQNKPYYQQPKVRMVAIQQKKKKHELN